MCILIGFFAALAGCRHAGEAPALAVREWRTWAIPADGATLPAVRSIAAGLHDEIAALDTAGRVLIYNPNGAILRQWKMLDVSVGKPEGIVVLKDGRIVVCDTHYHRVVYFDPTGKVLRVFGKMGTAPGEFIYPVGITKDADENLYICEYGGHDRVQKFTREGAWLLEFGGFGTGPGEFQRPSGLAWHAGKIYVTDAVNNRVAIFTDAGKYLGLLGVPETPLALDLPYDIEAGPDGTLWMIEYGAGRISHVSIEGRLLGRFGRTGAGENEFATPWGIALDRTGRIFIADTKNRRIVAVRF